MTVFAVDTDVEQALRRALTDDEDTYVDGVIAEAQDLVVAHLGRGEDPYEDGEVPGTVTRVTARMTARVFQQTGQAIGASQQQQSAGPFSTGQTFTTGANTGGPWLSAADKKALAPYRLAGGMRSVSFTSERGYDALS